MNESLEPITFKLKKKKYCFGGNRVPIGDRDMPPHHLPLA